MPDIFQSESSITKWEVLKQLAKAPSSPNILAKQLNTTIANISQHLKLLEAYGYIKSRRIDRGKGSRKQKKSRILYSLTKHETTIYTIMPQNVMRKEIKQTPTNIFLINLMLLDLKGEDETLLKFYADYKELIDKSDAIYYLKTQENEIHLLIITQDLEAYRGTKSTKKIDTTHTVNTVRFWSHTLDEVRDGLRNKEKYFQDQIKQGQILIEKKAHFSDQIWEATYE